MRRLLDLDVNHVLIGCGVLVSGSSVVAYVQGKPSIAIVRLLALIALAGPVFGSWWGDTVKARLKRWGGRIGYSSVGLVRSLLTWGIMATTAGATLLAGPFFLGGSRQQPVMTDDGGFSAMWLALIAIIMSWLHRLLTRARELGHAKTTARIRAHCVKFLGHCAVVLFTVLVAAGMEFLTRLQVEGIPLLAALIGLVTVNAVKIPLDADRDYRVGKIEHAEERELQNTLARPRGMTRRVTAGRRFQRRRGENIRLAVRRTHRPTQPVFPDRKARRVHMRPAQSRKSDGQPRPGRDEDTHQRDKPGVSAWATLTPQDSGTQTCDQADPGDHEHHEDAPGHGAEQHQPDARA